MSERLYLAGSRERIECTLHSALADGATAAALGVSDDERQDIEAKAGNAATLTESDVTTEPVEQAQMWAPDPED